MPKEVSIYVFFGLIATGKSFLGSAWAKRHDFAYLNSDRVRKELAGLAVTASSKVGLNKGIYSAEFSRRTYDELLSRAERQCAAARSVVIDASYQKRAERDRVRRLAERLGAGLFFILCQCPEEEILRRLEIRSRDPEAVSDGRPEIYLAQKERFEYPEEMDESQLITLSTVTDPEGLLDGLDTILEVK
jgi:predicted kinase